MQDQFAFLCDADDCFVRVMISYENWEGRVRDDLQLATAVMAYFDVSFREILNGNIPMAARAGSCLAGAPVPDACVAGCIAGNRGEGASGVLRCCGGAAGGTGLNGGDRVSITATPCCRGAV